MDAERMPHDPPGDTAPEPTDAELVHRCRAGDAVAWAALVRRFQRLVYTVPRRARLPEADAADVFQTSFMRLFEHLARLDDPSRVRAWLVTTARRETLRRLEQQQRNAIPAPSEPDGGDPNAGLVERIADPAPLPDAALASLQEQDRVRRAVERLDERSRRFIELAFLQDPPLPYAELAQRLGIAEGSIGPTRARCLDKLRRVLATM